MQINIQKGWPYGYNPSHKLLGRLDKIGDTSVKHFAENFWQARGGGVVFQTQALLKLKLITVALMIVLFVP